ncbi:MAG: phosphatidylserine/phosphatidylglycerophosphate/cardiolipin synthase family protein [Rhodospirillales bacterium]|nr:phosphatidylserine/phosphatidylglycerophosphate/cardiolipin synthase family protein [Rhodospirillales bacterium]
MTAVVTAVDGSYIPGTTSGPYPARPGNRVRAFIDGPQIVRRIGEAIAKARHSVWLTVAFYSDDFLLPEGQEPLFDVLERAVARGVDVRLLIWRPNPETAPSPRMFGGSPEQRALLARRGSRLKIRWDRAATVFCQHQKSWVIDAGQPSETSFVGGLNLTSVAMRLHDVYVEVTGPSATDVRHNFVERWNEASERYESDGNWCCDGGDELPYADQPRGACGPSTVQIQRMLDASRYPPVRVERSILEQYQRAIDAARRTIYLQNQAIPMPEVARHLVAAAERGVEIVMLVPPAPEGYVFDARHKPEEASRFWGIETLARHANFTLSGLAEMRDGKRHAAYVHAKMMVVDDVWVTVGSCNLHPFSLAGHTEMNASIWDAAVARDLRQRLFAQHLGVDTAAVDDRAALRLFSDAARKNRLKLDAHEEDWQGLVFALSPELYATPSEVGGRLKDR